MKKIEAIIRMSKFEEIQDALAQIEVNFFTLQNVKGFGLEKGEAMTYRGSHYGPGYIPRLQINILAAEEKIDSIIETILKFGKTGDVGDGKIIVYDVEKVVRIRTGETDGEAI
jgi:nitrogen regulatory protein PII